MAIAFSSNATCSGSSHPRLAGLAGQHPEPQVHRARDAVAHRAASAVPLARRRGQEAAAREDVALQVGDPRVGYRPQPRQPRLLAGRAVPDLAAEDVGRLLQRRHLQRLLRPEVADDPGLRHVELAGQPPDRQALEPFERGDVDRAGDDRLAGLLGFGGGSAGHEFESSLI